MYFQSRQPRIATCRCRRLSASQLAPASIAALLIAAAPSRSAYINSPIAAAPSVAYDLAQCNKNMGCCNSAPTAPENIIPDPGEAEPCTFSLKSAGMMSSDYIAYQGEETSDKEKKWFFVNKTGSMWGGDAVIEIENFVRGGNPEKPNQGEISYRCAFDSSPNFQKHFKAPSSEFSPSQITSDG